VGERGDPRYNEFAVERIVEAVRRAHEAMEPAGPEGVCARPYMAMTTFIASGSTDLRMASLAWSIA